MCSNGGKVSIFEIGEDSLVKHSRPGTFYLSFSVEIGLNFLFVMELIFISCAFQGNYTFHLTFQIYLHRGLQNTLLFINLWLFGYLFFFCHFFFVSL